MPRQDLGGRLGVHHGVELGLDRIMQMLRRMHKQVALLVNSAALHRDVVPEAGERRLEAFAAIDDDKIGSGEPSAGQVVRRASQAASLSPCS